MPNKSGAIIKIAYALLFVNSASARAFFFQAPVWLSRELFLPLCGSEVGEPSLK